MAEIKALPTQFTPLEVTVTLPASETSIADAEAELRIKAETDTNHCYGYFPAMKGTDSINTDLPKSQAFAENVPTLEVEGKRLTFNFIRLSLIQQKSDSPFHLDSDAATALTGDTATISKRLVWRLLLNLNDKHARTLSYLDVDTSSMRLTNSDGYIHCEDEQAAETEKSIAIPPRNGQEVHGVLFCASRVLHTGKDDEFGHFVLGYGCEEADG